MAYWEDPAYQAHTFTVKVDGEDITDVVARCQVKQRAYFEDEVTVDVLNPSTGDESRRNLLRNGQEITVELHNAAGSTREIGRGFLPRIGWRAMAGAVPMSQIRAYGKSRDMMKADVSTGHKHKKDTQIVKDIAALYDVDVSFGHAGQDAIDDGESETETLNSRQQVAQNDWLFLQKLAKKNGVLCWCEYQPYNDPADNAGQGSGPGWVLHFQKPALQIPPEAILLGWPGLFRVPTLHYGGPDGTLAEVVIDHTKTDIHKSIELVAFDWNSGDIIRPDPATAPYGDETTGGDDSKRVIIETPLDRLFPRHQAQREVEGKKDEERRTYVRMKGRVPMGAPIYRAYVYGVQNVLGDMGVDFSGLWWFDMLHYDMSGTSMKQMFQAYLAAGTDEVEE